MKKTLLLLILFIPVSAFADTPSRLNDGVVKFAYGNVGSTMAWSASAYDQMVEDCVGACPQQTYSPALWEINLSTCIAFQTEKYRAFDNYSDWMAVRTKKGLRRKVQAMRLEYDSMQDLSAGDKVDIIQRYNWLKSYYNQIP